MRVTAAPWRQVNNHKKKNMNQEIKSKAEALKYAIEFTAENGKPNYKAAQEMFDFINKNLSLSDDTINLARLHIHTQKRIGEIAMHANVLFNSLLQYTSSPRRSPSEIAKEKGQTQPLPGSSTVDFEMDYIRNILRCRGYKYRGGIVSSDGYICETFDFEDNKSFIKIKIERLSKIVKSSNHSDAIM